MYRAYWAIPRTMKTSGGEQVNTVFGVASMLLQILKSEEPDSIVFCFDAGDETFRHKEYGEYKSGRAETPDDFYTQIPRTLELIDTFNIKSVSGLKYEADDYACTYALQAAAQGDRVTIVTGDRDLFQVVSEKIRVSVPHKGYLAAEYFGPGEVEKKFGVTPQQIPSYKGLVGDSSDNLAGVKGIGPVAAAALLQEFGSLENIYENLEKVKNVWRTKLEAGREQAFFCKRMAALICDIPETLPLADFVFKDIPTAPIFSMFHKLEFSLIARRFEAFLETPYGRLHFRKDHAASVSVDTTLVGVAGVGPDGQRWKKSEMKKEKKTESPSDQLSLL